MATREIVKEGDERLTKICRSVLEFDERLSLLIDDMIETMHKAEGVGLAAPQVGVLRRICVIDTDEDGGALVLVNPSIVKQSGEQCEIEGCLSCPGDWGYTKRPMSVTVKANDRYGKNFTVSGVGLKARALCHEIDHLDGKLFKEVVVKKGN